VHEAAQAVPGDALRAVGQLEVRDPDQEPLDCGLRLEPRQGRPGSLMDPLAEAQVAHDPLAHVERVRALELELVPIRRPERHDRADPFGAVTPWSVTSVVRVRVLNRTDMS